MTLVFTSILSAKSMSRLHYVLIFVVVFLVYLWSAPRTVVLEDDGLFILSAYFNGISHPPGYPLYTLLAHLMTQLPFGSVAYRVHTLSALFGALSCVSLWWVVRQLLVGRIYAYTVSLAFAFSQVYWSQAIVAEVYTLNVFLFLSLLALALRYTEQADSGSGRLLAWMGLLYGLSLSNHWPLLLLSTPMLMAVMWPQRRRLIRQIPMSLPFLLVGLLPYVWMVLRSQMDPEISFYGPMESWTDFWFVVSREGYAGLDNSLSATWWDKLQFSGFVLRETVEQLGPIAAVLAMLGFWGQWRVWPQRICLALILGYLGNTFVLIALLGFDYELLHRNIFRVYPLIAYMVLSLWMGLGMYLLTDYLVRRWGKFARGRVIRLGLGGLVIGSVLLLSVGTNYRANDDWTETYANSILESLEPNASFFLSSDSILAPVAYLNLVNNIRPDITLYQTHGLIFSNRLYRSDKNTEEERNQRIDEFISANQNPVYYEKYFPHDYGEEHHGLYHRVRRKSTEDNLHFVINQALIKNIEGILAKGEPIDPWGQMSYRRINQGFCYLLAGVAKFNKAPEKQSFFQGRFERYCQSYHGYLGLISQMLTDDNFDAVRIAAYFSQAEKLREQAITKEEYARLDNYRGSILLNDERYAEASRYFKRSMEIWPHPSNDAYSLNKLSGKK